MRVDGEKLIKIIQGKGDKLDTGEMFLYTPGVIFSIHVSGEVEASVCSVEPNAIKPEFVMLRKGGSGYYFYCSVVDTSLLLEKDVRNIKRGFADIRSKCRELGVLLNM